MKKRLVSLLLAFSLFCLTSCADGISVKKASALISETLQFIHDKNYSAAGVNFHPSVSADAGQSIEAVLQEWVIDLREHYGFDLSQKITDIKTTGFHLSLYTTAVRGSYCELNLSLKIGGKNASMTAAVVQNGEGYGIYSFYITPVS